MTDKSELLKIADNIQLLIKNKYMIVDVMKYHVAMLDNLYNIFGNTELINFCNRIKIYCDLQNGWSLITPITDEQAPSHTRDIGNRLLISLKYENNEVKPFAYFDYTTQSITKY